MEQQVITDISLSARIIGAAFYYPPTEKSDIVELLSSGKWLTEWPYGSGAFPYYEGLAMLATLTLKSWQSLLSITPVEKQLFC